MALKPTVKDKHMTRSGIHRALKTLEEGKFLLGYHQLIKQSEAAKYALMEIAVELITDEVSAASLSPIPLLGDFSASGLESFNWIQTLAEYERICPLLLACLRAALTTKQGQRGSTRDQETVNPAIGVILSLIFYMSAPERYKIQNHIEALASWIPHWENKTPKPKKAPESSSFTKPSPRAKRSKTSQQKPPKQPTPEKLYHKTKVMYGTNIIENLEMDVSEENSTTDLASVIKQEETVISQSNASSEGDQSGFLIEINQSEAFSEGDQPGSTMKISKSQALSALTGFSQSEPPFDDDLAGHDNSSGLSDAVEESALNRTAEVGTESFDSPWTDRPQAPGDSTVCPTCGKTLRDKYSLQRHLNLHNGGHKCPHCPKIYSEERVLATHIRTVHYGELFKCTVCEKTYQSKYGLKQHMQEHLNKYKFHCEICSRGFNYKTMFENHLNRHRGIKPFRCEGCLKTFVSKGVLNRHKLICGNTEKLYQCEICQKGYKTEKYLEEHMVLHSDVVHQCPHCPMTYPLRASLSGHIARKHKIEVVVLQQEQQLEHEIAVTTHERVEQDEDMD